jgi:hypothetical protein
MQDPQSGRDQLNPSSASSAPGPSSPGPSSAGPSSSGPSSSGPSSSGANATPPTTGATMAPPVPSGQPKWAALLQTGAPSTPEADLPTAQSAQPFPGLGKTQAGNILASLASQPATAVKQPAAPARPASSAPTALGVANGAPALKPRQALSQLPGAPRATSPGTPSVGVAPAGAVTSSHVDNGAVSGRPAPNASADGRAADGRNAEGRNAEGRNADGRNADGRAADGGAAEPDQGSDDILPSKPRSSLRLRPNFRLPRLPRLKRPTFRLR